MCARKMQPKKLIVLRYSLACHPENHRVGVSRSKRTFVAFVISAAHRRRACVCACSKSSHTAALAAAACDIMDKI
jgi:hypothetical protein